MKSFILLVLATTVPSTMGGHLSNTVPTAPSPEPSWYKITTLNGCPIGYNSGTKTYTPDNCGLPTTIIFMEWDNDLCPLDFLDLSVCVNVNTLTRLQYVNGFNKVDDKEICQVPGYTSYYDIQRFDYKFK